VFVFVHVVMVVVMVMVMVAACPATTHPCSRRALVDPSVAARLGNTTSRLVAPSAVIDTSRNCRLVVVAGWVEDGCWWLCCLG
jgi:ABC-type enterobactin transport system permease subunit